MSFLETLKSIDLKIRNYKCFADSAGGFDTLRPTNVIVGRNNSGKSALLDLVELACDHKGVLDALRHQNLPSQVLLTKPLVDSELRRIFSESTSGGDIGGNHWKFGMQFIGEKITIELQNQKKQSFVSLQSEHDYARAKKHFAQVAEGVQNPLKDKLFRRLVADRDIVAENDSQATHIGKNGAGFTNTVQCYLNKSSLPSKLIEGDLLVALNRIFAPDASFSGIEVQQHGNGTWEVYLEEGEKGRIALSHSGSGLKTVLLVLGFVVLLPVIENHDLSKFVFAFEELENNLHPALQRRLVKFLRDLSVEKECLIFLTTHSSAMIDLLSHDVASQIIHVTHDGKTAKVRHVQTYYDNRGILDDLDIRASDLLQANGIVWVEGPSDRLYFNRWMALVTDGVLQEGAHYQCVSYGGRLLAHLSGAEPFQDVDAAEAIKVLRVNRNAMILIDSDKRVRNSTLNDTKKRIIAEFDEFGGMTWVSKGR